MTIALPHTSPDPFPKLLQPAARALSMPASSAPVQRVFSQGGIILKPHCEQLSRHTALKTDFLELVLHVRLSTMIHSDFNSSALLTTTFAVLSRNTISITSTGTCTGT